MWLNAIESYQGEELCSAITRAGQEQFERFELPLSYPAELLPDEGVGYVKDAQPGMSGCQLIQLATERGFKPTWTLVARLGAGYYELGLTIGDELVLLLVHMKVVCADR